jgi:GTP-dependent phosphoenolpyruvate carboxykinase
MYPYVLQVLRGLYRLSQRLIQLLSGTTGVRAGHTTGEPLNADKTRHRGSQQCKSYQINDRKDWQGQGLFLGYFNTLYVVFILLINCLYVV